jgi:hypothetical protein
MAAGAIKTECPAVVPELPHKSRSLLPSVPLVALLSTSFWSVKNFHTATALIELGAGLALLCCPSAAVVLLVGESLEAPAALTVVRIGGAGLLALGWACWLARGDTHSQSARGLVAAMLLYNVAAAALLAFARVGYGLQGVALWPGVVLHAAMTVWCVACLRAGN